MGTLINLGDPQPEPKVSRAVIANGAHHNGCVVWWTGTHLHYEIHEAADGAFGLRMASASLAPRSR